VKDLFLQFLWQASAKVNSKARFLGNVKIAELSYRVLLDLSGAIKKSVIEPATFDRTFTQNDLLN